MFYLKQNDCCVEQLRNKINHISSYEDKFSVTNIFITLFICFELNLTLRIYQL